MPDLIANSQSWLAQQQKTHLARTVTYRRGGAWVDIDAMVGRWEYEQTAFDDGDKQRLNRIRTSAADCLRRSTQLRGQHGRLLRS